MRAGTDGQNQTWHTVGAQEIFVTMRPSRQCPWNSGPPSQSSSRLKKLPRKGADDSSRFVAEKSLVLEMRACCRPVLGEAAPGCGWRLSQRSPGQAVAWRRRETKPPLALWLALQGLRYSLGAKGWPRGPEARCNIRYATSRLSLRTHTCERGPWFRPVQQPKIFFLLKCFVLQDTRELS